MNRLETALQRFEELEDDTLLIRYLRNHSSDEILDDADALNIDVSYEDVMGLSAYALADLIIDQI